MEIKNQNIWDKLFSYKSFVTKKYLVANDLQLKNLSHMFWLSFSSWKVCKQGVLFL
jgi:hypothetical protein